MVYIMEFYVDGGCRGNGSSNAIGAAACAMKKKWGGYNIWTRHLSFDHYAPTNQRAEITAIILALEIALEKYGKLFTNPHLQVTIYSDSRYAVGCMTKWIYKWSQNGWINSAGNEVANRDLIQEARRLETTLPWDRSVKYVWIPREKNEVADTACNEALDD